MLKRTTALLVAALAAAVVLCAGTPVRADEGEVDLLLVLAADVSRSVDDDKFKLQREGYAAAIADPRVVRAMTGGPNRRIALAFVEWASEWEQRIVVDWTVVNGDGDARSVSARVLTAERSFRGRTSISSAIDFSMIVLARSPFQSGRKVIDISGDGTNNSGRDVISARDEAIGKGVTINGLVILSEAPLATNPSHTHPPGGLTAYYENNVIGGPGAFVIEAENFEAFGQLIISKLVKEIAELAPRRM